MILEESLVIRLQHSHKVFYHFNPHNWRGPLNQEKVIIQVQGITVESICIQKIIDMW